MSLYGIGNERTYKSDVMHLLSPDGMYPIPKTDNAAFTRSLENSKSVRGIQYFGKYNGGVIVFPINNILNFSKILISATNRIIKKLKSEYSPNDENFDNYSIDNDGYHFSAVYRNNASGEEFNSSSYALTLSNAKSFTIDYIAERMFDAILKKTKRGISSILVCDLNSSDFYQYGVSQSILYNRPFTERHVREMPVYQVWLPS